MLNRILILKLLCCTIKNFNLNHLTIKMRFRFCGGLDCPDWVLAEITILAKMSSIKMKLLTGQVVKNLLGDSLDYEKVTKYTSAAKYDISDVKAALAVLSFILSSSAKYNVESSYLLDELQQLGLPKEHSVALCKVFSDNSTKLQEQFQLTSLRLAKLEKLEWQVKHVLDPTGSNVLEDPLVELKMVIDENNSKKDVNFTMTFTKFQLFLHEMKQARDAMKQVDSAL